VSASAESVDRVEVLSIPRKTPGRRVRMGLIGIAIGAGAGSLAFLSSDYKGVYAAPKQAPNLAPSRHLR